MDAVQQSAAACAHAAQPQQRRTSDRCDGLSGDGISRGRASEGYGENPDIKRPIQATAEQFAKLA
jgi:hypothetical protein